MATQVAKPIKVTATAVVAALTVAALIATVIRPERGGFILAALALVTITRGLGLIYLVDPSKLRRRQPQH